MEQNKMIFDTRKLSVSDIKNIFERVCKIKPFIHMVQASTRKSNIADVISVVGPLRSHLREHNPSHFMDEYRKASYGSFGKSKISIYHHGKDGYRPKCYFYIVGASQEDLYRLASRIPDLKISSVEYSIDFICDKPEAASMLMLVLRKHTYFPYKASPECSLRDFRGVLTTRESNAVHSVWNRDGKTKGIRLYERGKDKDKVCGHWRYDRIDRVRVEFLIPGRVLKRHGIGMLAEFVKGNQFPLVIAKRFRFACFYRENGLPKPTEAYLNRDSRRNSECLQSEIIAAKKRLFVVSRQIRDVKFMIKYKKMIIDRSNDFDRLWTTRYNKLIVNS